MFFAILYITYIYIYILSLTDNTVTDQRKDGDIWPIIYYSTVVFSSQ